ncbi:unnamed protein product [Rhizophagus irregularis]|nr:unnamed protein product [Rhizophagus irregularis]
MTTKKKSIIASYYGTGYKRIKNEFLDSDFPKRGKLLIFNHEMLFVKLDQLKIFIIFWLKERSDFIGIIRGNVTITDNEIYDLYDFDWHYFYEGDLCV